MDTSRVDGVKAPPHDGTPRSHGFSIFSVVRQDVVDLPIFQLAHVVLDGVACADIDQ